MSGDAICRRVGKSFRPGKSIARLGRELLPIVRTWIVIQNTAMNLVLQTPDEAPPMAGRDLNVVILCVDPLMVSRAAEILKLLELNLKEETEGRLVHEWWDYEVLAFYTLREIAATRAMAADVIIIGVQGEDLPWMVTDWMTQWLHLRKGRPGALVAVVEGDFHGSLKTLSQLKEVAALGHMEFFSTNARNGGEESGESQDSKEVARQFVKSHKTNCRANMAGQRAGV